jgi:hypothetical protein
MNAAIVENGIVINVIVVDNIDVIPNLVEIPDGKFIHIGDNIENMVGVPVSIDLNSNKTTAPTVL